MKKVLSILALLSSGAQAQDVTPCRYEGDSAYLSSIAVVAEPWAENTRLFADGAVRLVVLDTEEPAFAAYHLAVLIWGEDEIGIIARRCVLVSLGQVGFFDVTLNGMDSR